MSQQVMPTTVELQLKKHSLRAPERKILSEASSRTVEMTPDMQASVVFDMTCIRFGWKNLAISLHLKKMGYPASESLVSRWRSAEYRETPSTAQIFALGADFQRLFKKEQEKFHGWPKRALLDLVDAVADLAEALEA